MTPRSTAGDWWIPPRLLFPVALATGAVVTAMFVATHLENASVTAMFGLAPSIWVKSWGGWARLASAAGTHGRATAAALAVLGVASAAGGPMLHWLGSREWLGRMATGLGVCALGALALALLGLISGPVLGIAGAGLGGWGAWSGIGSRAGRARGWAAPGWALIAIGLMLASDLVAVWCPEWFLDGRMYHLAIPERILQTGKFSVMSGHLLTFLPLNTEMLFLSAMAAGGEEAAKVLNLAFGVLLLSAVAGLAARLGQGSARTGWVAALVLVSFPLTMVENEISFSDNLRGLYETLALSAIVDLLARRRGALAMAAACTGLAMGTKYLAVIRGGLLVTAVLLLPGAGARRSRLGRGAALTGGASLVLAPWLCRNWLAGRDPVYPFGLAWFGSLGFSPGELAAWMADNRHYGIATQTWSSWLTLPFRVALEPVPGEFGTFTTGPIALAAGVLLAARRRWPREALLVALIVLVEALIWSGTSELIRYLLPALAALAALAGWAIGELQPRWPRWERLWILLVCAWAGCALVLRVHHRYNLSDLYGAGGHLLGKFTPGDAIAARGFGESAMAALPAGKVLLVGEDQPLGLRRVWEGCTVYNRMTIHQWALSAADARRFGLKVRQSGIRAVILNLQGFRDWESRGPVFAIGPRELAMLNPWWRSLRRTRTDGPRVYYAVPRP